MKKYRIIGFSTVKTIKDGFSSIRAAAAWAEDNMYFGGIWSAGWDIEAYEE